MIVKQSDPPKKGQPKQKISLFTMLTQPILEIKSIECGSCSPDQTCNDSALTLSDVTLCVKDKTEKIATISCPGEPILLDISSPMGPEEIVVLKSADGEIICETQSISDNNGETKIILDCFLEGYLCLNYCVKYNTPIPVFAIAIRKIGEVLLFFARNIFPSLFAPIGLLISSMRK